MWYPTSLKSSKVHFSLRWLSTAGHRHDRKISLRGFWSAGRRINGRRAPVAKRKFSLTTTAQNHPTKLSADSTEHQCLPEDPMPDVSGGGRFQDFHFLSYSTDG